jgi:hypothetical protein
MNKIVLEKRTYVLSKVVDCVADLYHNGDLDEGQKGLIETLLGAGIWYLPSGNELFSGKISEAALNKIRLNSDIELVEEHGFPRKVAGKSFFHEHLDEIKSNANKLYDLYYEKMGRFNLVLKEENNKLRRFQKTSVFKTEEEAYKLAGIILVPLEERDFEIPQLKNYKPKNQKKLT